MMQFKKIIYLLTPEEIKSALILLLIILIMAILEMIGVASILPFMAVLSNPDLIQTNIFLKKLFNISQIFGVSNNQQFFFYLGILVFIILLISLIFKALTTYLQVRFIRMREYSIGKRLIEVYLKQPYSWFLNRHSADIGKTILSEVDQVVINGISPLISLIARALVIIALVTLLILSDPKLAIIIGFMFSFVYGVVYKFTRRYLSKIGNESLKNNQLRFIAVNEAFSASKEVKIGGLEQTYIDYFSKPAKIFAKKNTTLSLIASLPRFILEAIAFGGILLLILFMIAKTGSFNNALPILSLYVFAGYRLLPAFHQIYNSFTQLTFAGPSIDKLYNDFQNMNEQNLSQNIVALTLSKEINLKNVHYNYPNSSRTALKNISLNIPAKKTIGLIGITGSGKTTLVDIILGLLQPQKGFIEVDGEEITQQNSRNWQKSIGYVPQNIYLSDDDITRNIAFGVNPENINNEDVEKASKVANFHDFVLNELPKKYGTKIGERGVRLSGGQRQRLGIARALYHKPQVLVFDEATSALDNQTEKAVMDAVNNLDKKITIIIVAHRLNTLKNCDKIFKLENGQIIKHGNFEQIVEK